MTLAVVVVLLSYLLGSIPFSYLVARRLGVDVRRVGSGNVGATNVMRSAGRAALTRALRELAEGAFSWVTLTSPRTVDVLAEHLTSRKLRTNVAAIGGVGVLDRPLMPRALRLMVGDNSEVGIQ